MNNEKILGESSFLPHHNPKKLIFMLHGYGDTADNFVHIAGFLEKVNLKALILLQNHIQVFQQIYRLKLWF